MPNRSQNTVRLPAIKMAAMHAALVALEVLYGFRVEIVECVIKQREIKKGDKATAFSPSKTHMKIEGVFRFHPDLSSSYELRRFSLQCDLVDKENSFLCRKWTLINDVKAPSVLTISVFEKPECGQYLLPGHFEIYWQTVGVRISYFDLAMDPPVEGWPISVEGFNFQHRSVVGYLPDDL